MIKELVSAVSESYEKWRTETRLGITRNDLALKIVEAFNKLETEVRSLGFLEQFEELTLHVGFAHVHDSNPASAARIKFRAAVAIGEIIEGGDTLEIYQGLVFLKQRKDLLEGHGGKFDSRFLGKRREMRQLLKKCNSCGRYRWDGAWINTMPSGKFEVLRSLCPLCRGERG